MILSFKACFLENQKFCLEVKWKSTQWVSLTPTPWSLIFFVCSCICKMKLLGITWYWMEENKKGTNLSLAWKEKSQILSSCTLSVRNDRQLEVLGCIKLRKTGAPSPAGLGKASPFLLIECALPRPSISAPVVDFVHLLSKLDKHRAVTAIPAVALEGHPGDFVGLTDHLQSMDFWTFLTPFYLRFLQCIPIAVDMRIKWVINEFNAYHRKLN